LSSYGEATMSCAVRITGSFGCALIIAFAQAKPWSVVRQSSASSSHERPAAWKMCAVL
jgi:hypothetical protein